MMVKCSVSLGELVDKIAILKIKQINITDQIKRDHAKKEEEELLKTLKDLNLDGVESFLFRLVDINSKLWVIEDKIRDLEAKKCFDDEFIRVARSVYVSNDIRFNIKNELNNHFGSDILEVKSYKKY